MFFTERFPLCKKRGGCVRDKTQCGVLTAYLSSVSLQLHLEIQQLFQNQKIYEELFFYAAFPKLFFSTHRLSWVWGLFFYIIHVLLCFFFLCLPLVLPSLSWLSSPVPYYASPSYIVYSSSAFSCVCIVQSFTHSLYYIVISPW